MNAQPTYMKQIVFLIAISFFPLAGFSQNDDCKKHMRTTKQKKKSLFESQQVKTDYVPVFTNGSRRIHMSLVRKDTALMVDFTHSFTGSALKRRFVLGPDIRILIMFSDSTTNVFKFDDSEQAVNRGNMMTYTNYSPLDLETLKKMMGTGIAYIQVDNPFGMDRGQALKDDEVNERRQERFMKLARCFYDRAVVAFE